MFGGLKDWRRVATRYDRCPKVFLSAIALAATVIYWLCILNLGDPRKGWMAPTTLQRFYGFTSGSFDYPNLVKPLVLLILGGVS